VAGQSSFYLGLSTNRQSVALAHVLGERRTLPLTSSATKHARSITGSWDPTTRGILTDIEIIRHWLYQYKLSKWGFLIYRCTYEDDKAWQRFMETLKELVHCRLERDDGLDLEESLELTVRDNRAELDGASVDQVRERFKAWVGEDGKAEQQGADYFNRTPRYVYCIHIDAAALDSVGGMSLNPDYSSLCYVNIVDASWEFDPEEEVDETDDRRDIGYLRMDVHQLIPEAYSFFQEREGYYVVYRTPPQVIQL
jgi:hypothetical protein